MERANENETGTWRWVQSVHNSAYNGFGKWKKRTVGSPLCKWLVAVCLPRFAEGEGFKPPIPERGIPDFESSAIDHSANLPFFATAKLAIYFQLQAKMTAFFCLQSSYRKRTEYLRRRGGAAGRLHKAAVRLVFCVFVSQLYLNFYSPVPFIYI